jgi:MoaA/NifB/PqqE/SkfB family radical SAM enzyme
MGEVVGYRYFYYYIFLKCGSRACAQPTPGAGPRILYINPRGFAQGCAFWGFHHKKIIFGEYSPKLPYYWAEIRISSF